ncbi:hypothetical protein FZEAL_9916 [Fusarium zealandicum]|uniref:Uncharacterized protein n=1 Tax=Fusarium zealandicum TaxID=1053134 RepID=A0A8H4XED3_9HYPO|nr:hypothetical protein FZEAL_9916 [Fusarium zealandicum]
MSAMTPDPSSLGSPAPYRIQRSQTDGSRIWLKETSRPRLISKGRWAGAFRGLSAEDPGRMEQEDEDAILVERDGKECPENAREDARGPLRAGPLMMAWTMRPLRLTARETTDPVLAAIQGKSILDNWRNIGEPSPGVDGGNKEFY